MVARDEDGEGSSIMVRDKVYQIWLEEGLGLFWRVVICYEKLCEFPPGFHAEGWLKVL